MKYNNAGSDVCEQHTPPRSWGGFVRSAPLLTSTSVRRRIQFLHGDTPSAELAVWACIVPAGTMQHPFLRHSWMRFAQRTYTILPRQPSQPIFGELSISVSRSEGLTTFISNRRPTTDTIYLEFAGVHAISLSSAPSLVPVNLVRSSGAPALTGHFLADMLPRDGASSETEISVANSYQTITLSGSTDLEPGDLLGTSSSPLIQIPTSALQNITAEPLPTGAHALHDNMRPTKGSPGPSPLLYQRYLVPSSYSA